ncbi:hypothetical protein ACT3SZ_13020 [Corynebacterium sp. AOP40-9SA-29]|uniref:hypothetical protein n=1 Tax=Corynebacterium sp. AOP40-9SA-29 TaxID=3457677 RepID=UPI004033AF2B
MSRQHPRSVLRRTWRSTARTGSRTALGAVVLAGGLLLTACGSDIPGELADVRWQVGRIEDAGLADSGTAVASSLSETDQARTWLALGGSTVTGGAGCMSISGDVEWLDNDRVQFPGLSARDISGESEGTQCLPNDRELAERLVTILGEGEGDEDGEGDDETPTLRWETPGEDELRLTRADDSPSAWQTGRFVEFLATP